MTKPCSLTLPVWVGGDQAKASTSEKVSLRPYAPCRPLPRTARYISLGLESPCAQPHLHSHVSLQQGLPLTLLKPSVYFLILLTFFPSLPSLSLAAQRDCRPDLICFP